MNEERKGTNELSALFVPLRCIFGVSSFVSVTYGLTVSFKLVLSN